MMMINHNSTPIGIYIHIPFCAQKCGYCDFYSVAGGGGKLMDGYLEALQLQIQEVFATENLHNADTIYIGGGTPSVFGGKRLEKLLKALGKRVRLHQRAEITVEVNPESVNAALLKSLKSAGVNRISMGVQSADNAMLAVLGRVHTFETVKKAVDLCRNYITDNIAIDLMYGLPGQEPEDWQKTLSKGVALEPAHISCYGLKVEEGTPLYYQNPVLPDEDIQADMYLRAVDYLAQQGYVQYEISNFARSGLVSRHNSRYWELDDYIGLGCGAHGYYMGKRYSYIKDVGAFIQAMKKGGSVVDQTDEEAFCQRYGEYIMLGLRTTKGVGEEKFRRKFPMGDFTPFARKLEEYLPSGYVIRENGAYRLTPQGFLISNRIIGDVIDL